MASSSNFDPQIDLSLICPNCQYDHNKKGSLKCEICQTNLISKNKLLLQKKHKADKVSCNNEKSNTIKPYIHRKVTELVGNIKVHKLTKNQRKELEKPINLIGLVILSVVTTIFISYFVFKEESNHQKISETKLNSDVPQGIFNYAGSSVFAPLVAAGVNESIEQYEGFNLRYTKPHDKDFTLTKAFEMLIDGELSFIYSDRPLSDAEYQKANLRSIKIGRVPIAIDGIVFYVNDSLPLKSLNQGQINKIFTGKVKNWKEIDPQIKVDLPISPIVVKGSEIPGISIDNNIIKSANNYTLSLRQLLADPGAISFGSASLVKNQRLIRMLGLADGDSINYIQPLTQGKLNLLAFSEGIYPMTRRVFVIYRLDNTNDQKAAETLINYLKSNSGQVIVEKAGFVSIY